MFCVKCGNELEPGDSFCSKCGVKVVIEQENTVPIDDEMNKAIEELKKGNESGFATIYSNTYKYVYSRAKYILHDEQEALDLVQEVYFILYKNIKTLKINESIYAWLKTVIFRQGIKTIQRKNKSTLLLEEESEVLNLLKDEKAEIEKEYVKKQDIQIIRGCIERLSEEQRIVVLAYYYDNMKVSEIAELLDISEGTVKSRLSLARKHLEKSISEEEKKCGYKLHSFGGITLLVAIEVMLNLNKEVSGRVKDLLFVNISEHLGISVSNVVVAKEAIDGTAKVGETVVKSASNVLKKKITMAIAGAVVVGVITGVLITGVNKNHDIPIQKDAVRNETIEDEVEENKDSVLAKGIECYRWVLTYYKNFIEDGCLYPVEYISGLHCQYPPRLEEIYYTFVDMAEDGTPELFIGYQDIIVDIYTYVPGEWYSETDYVEWLCSGQFGDRNHCTICTNNLLKMDYSGGATTLITGYYSLETNSSKLTCVEAIERDGDNYYWGTYDAILDDFTREATASANDYEIMQTKYPEDNTIIWHSLAEWEE